MDKEYRKQLLNYITNNVEETTQTSNPFKEELIEYQNNLSDFISNGIYEETQSYPEFIMKDYLQIEGNSNYLIYGWYWTTLHERVDRGYIVVLDENLNPIQLILKFDSGTLLRKLDALNIDEEGRIYGVDTLSTWNSNVETKTRRFILLNNVLTSNIIGGEYKVILRNSYSLQYNYMQTKKVYKKRGSADYMIIGQNENNSYKISVVTFKINVGSSNEWAIYNSNYTLNGDIWTYLSWYDEITNLKIITNEVVGSTPRYLELLFNGSAFSVNLNYDLLTLSSIYSSNLISHLVFKDDNEVYYQIGMFDIVLKTNYNTNSYDIIYYNSDTEHNTSILFTLSKASVFIARDYYYTDSSNNYHEFLKYGLIENDTLYFSNEIEMVGAIGQLFSEGFFISKSSFNLVELSVQGDNNVILLPVDYNTLNYNGDPYSSYNSLKSNKMTLYNNGRLIFSRNLYNKVITNNTTTSTVEIPNTMLNDINITKEKLISETNININEENLTLRKNIYERLYLNFNNTINVIDEDENKSYPAVAQYIVNNINVGTQANYDDTTMGKVRINYNDDTSTIINTTWIRIDNLNKITEFIVYADKQITSIEYISNDENFVYLKKDVTTIQGKIYKIKQKIRTGNRATLEQLLYNNEPISYNNQPVNVVIEQ